MIKLKRADGIDAGSGTTLLAALESSSVFYISKLGKSFEVGEACDHYFDVKLTRKQLLQLADEIRVLAAD